MRNPGGGPYGAGNAPGEWISRTSYAEGARNLMGGSATLQQKLWTAAGGQALKETQLRERVTWRALGHVVWRLTREDLEVPGPEGSSDPEPLTRKRQGGSKDAEGTSNR